VLHHIPEVHLARGGLPNPAADADQVVVAGRLAVSDGYLADDQAEAATLELAIGHAALAQELGARNIEPDQVAGVIHHPHLIGFGIIDAHQSLGYGRGLGGHDSLMGL
jgi:hypothetical protein